MNRMLSMLSMLSILLALLLLAVPASALNYVGGSAPGAIPTIASVAPANASFVQGTSAGTLITPLTTLMSPPSSTFSGTYALSTSLGVNFPCTPTLGANNSLVQISGANLQVSSAGAAQGQGTYAVCLVAQQAGIANSPFALAMTLTINAAGQTIASNSISNSSFVAGSASATIVGALSTTMSPASPPFAGSYTGLNGTDAASFQIAVHNLETNGVLCSSPPCTYHVNPIAAQSGISNSPFSSSMLTITANAPVFTALGISGTTFLSSTPNAVVGTLSTTLSTGTPNPTYAIVSSGTDHSSTTCTSTNGANFQIVGAVLETNGTGLTAGIYPGVCVSATQAGVTFIQAFTLTGSSSGPVVGSLTIHNTSGSTTPSGSAQTCLTSGVTCFPKRFGYGFAIGAVPSGSIAVPTVGATAIRYQADLCTFWPDGSLKHCSFKAYVPQLAAGSTEQISFAVQAGSYDHTSSGTVADITGGSDYKVELANESQLGRTNNANFSPGLSAATWTGGVATYTSSVATGLATGDGVKVGGLVSPGFSFTGSVSHTTLTTSANLGIGQIIQGQGGAYIVSGSAPTYTLSQDLGTIGSTTFTVDYNGYYVITKVDSTHFTVSMADNPGVVSDASEAFASFGQMPIGTNVAFVVSGGSVVSATPTHAQGAFSDSCLFTGNSLCNPANISQAIYGCTVKPSVSVIYDGTTHEPSSAVVHNGGSGCAVDGSGSYVCGFNKIETNSPGTVVQIEKGQLVDTWSAWGPCYDNTGGAAHTRYYIRIIVEHWKDAVGGTYAFRAVGMPTSGIYVPGGTMPSIMADACWQNGSTQIRGFCPGGSGPTANTDYEGINNTVQGGWMTVQASAKPDWSTNGTGLDAVELAYTTADEAFLKGSGLIPPPDDTARSGAASNFGSTIAFTGTQNQVFDQCQYYPMDLGCTDSDADWGNAGSHQFTSVISAGSNMCYLMMPFASDSGKSWCTQSRIAMASIYGPLGGALEPATGYPVNIISTGTYPLLTPLRASATSYMNFLDMVDPQGVASLQGADNNPGTAFDGVTTIQNKIDWGHIPASEMILPFVLEAEPFMYYEIDAFASIGALEGITDARNVTFSGNFSTVFTGLTSNSSGNGIRQVTWAGMSVSEAAFFLPTSFPEQAYYEFLLQQNFTFEKQEIELIGTMTDGDGTVSKGFSTASLGVFNTVADFLNLSAPLAQFMQGYHSLWLSMQKHWWAGKYPDLDTLWNYQTKTYFVHVTGQPCPYDSINYVWSFWTSLFGYNPAPGWNSTDATNPQSPNYDKRGESNNVTTTSGSSVISGNGVNLDYPNTSGIPMPALSRMIPTIVNPDGECIELTPSFAPNNDCGAVPTGTWPPPATINGTSNGTFQTTWYYYYPLSVSSGVLSTDNSGITGTMSISGTALTGPSGLAPGMFIGGVGVTGGTKILSGTSSPYTVNNSQTVGSETMVADPNMLVFTGTTTSTWGMVTSGTCGTNVAGFATANWENAEGQSGGDGRWAEYFGVAKMAKAAGGDFADADNTITNYTANGGAGYPTTINPEYLLGQSYVGGAN